MICNHSQGLENVTLTIELKKKKKPKKLKN